MFENSQSISRGIQCHTINYRVIDAAECAITSHNSTDATAVGVHDTATTVTGKSIAPISTIPIAKLTTMER